MRSGLFVRGLLERGLLFGGLLVRVFKLGGLLVLSRLHPSKRNGLFVGASWVVSESVVSRGFVGFW